MAAVHSSASLSRRPGKNPVRHVLSQVAKEFGVPLAELRKPSRGSPRAALARQAAMYLCHVSCALSFEAIGQAFGRDRTTVSHACRVIEQERDEAWFDKRIAALEQACRATQAVEMAR